jgi:hypothetical protein
LSGGRPRDIRGSKKQARTAEFRIRQERRREEEVRGMLFIDFRRGRCEVEGEQHGQEAIQISREQPLKNTWVGGIGVDIWDRLILSGCGGNVSSREASV